MFLALTLGLVANQPLIKLAVGVAGGAALLGFGLFQIREGLTLKQGIQEKENMPSKNPLLLGLVFTGLNPYFIIWWLTAGMPLIENALAIASFTGVFIMYASHVWMDYAWLTSTAYLAKKGTNLTGRKGYRILIITFGLILVFFGLYFLVTALS
jgi:threonine/homoserine/homoserine lactone efflux protein